jgi:two-component system cell cycle sensor histidine kinase PleC
MSKQVIDYQKLFEESPLARLVILQEKKDHFYVGHANQSAVNYFCPNAEGSCETIDGMYLRDFLDTANTTHILQALTVCFESNVPISIQVLPKIPGRMLIQSFLLNPILNGEGTVVQVEMQARPPATEQASIQRERDDALSMFTTVFDVSDVGITVTDHHGRFVRVNDSFLKQTGWTAIELMGEKLTKIIPSEDQKMAWVRHADALNQGRKNFGEIRILRADQSVMNVMVTSSMMELSNGRSFRITTCVDISELKKIEVDLRRAKDEADEANKAKSAFLANMSHELRTPLNAVIGFSEMMINGTLGVIENPHYIEYLGDIKFSAQHLLQIINDVLDMSKIEAGKMPLDEENTDIVGLLRSVKRLMIARAEQHNVTLRLDATVDMPLVSLDERLVRQVFLNLLSNSVKFSKDGGEVVIKIRHDDDIIVSVIDHGIGIPQERITEVLEPFGQVTDPSLNKGQGTGLGLPIAKAMMDMHGGDLAITSTKGEGTIVTCTFPKERIVVLD